MSRENLETIDERPSSEEAFSNAFESLAQSVPLIKQAVRQQLQEAEYKMQETLRRHEQMTREIIQAAIGEHERELEDKMRSIQHEHGIYMDTRTENVSNLTGNVGGRLQRFKKRDVSHSNPKCSYGDEDSLQLLRKKIEDIEQRLCKLEGSIDKALEKSFPRVNAILEHLEVQSVPTLPDRPDLSSTSNSNQSSETVHPSTTSSTSSSARVKPLVPKPPRVVLQRDLAAAAERGDVQEMKRLLDAGAEVNFNDDDGWSPLHYAACFAQADVVSVLLERGANVNAQTPLTRTALLLAAKNDRIGRCLNLLIHAGANVHCKDINGTTALMRAVKSGNEAAIPILLAAGAKRTDRDKSGRNVNDYANTVALRRLLRRS